MIRNEKKRNRISAAVAALLMLLSGCSQPEEIPELLEPVEVSLSGREVMRSDICDMEIYAGRVKYESHSYAFFENCKVKEIAVQLGEYVEEGQILAEMDCEEAEFTTAQMKRELAWQKEEDAYQTEMDDIDITLFELQYNANAFELTEEAREKQEEALEIMQKEARYEKELRKVEIEEQEDMLARHEQQMDEKYLRAESSGYVTYVKRFSAGNAAALVEADEIVVMISDRATAYVSADVVDSKAKNASEIYIEIEGVKYPLVYEPYTDAEKQLANKEELQPEARFFPVEGTELSELTGKTGELYLLSKNASNVLNIAPDSLFSEDGEYFVYLIKDGQKVKQPVTTGVHTCNAVEITEGLQEGDMVYYPLSDMPTNTQNIQKLEKSEFLITEKYDQVKVEYISSENILCKPDNAMLQELRVKNGQEVLEGDVIAVLFTEEGESRLQGYDLDTEELTRSYEYEKMLHQKELEKLLEKIAEMEKGKLQETYEYKKTAQEVRRLNLQMDYEAEKYQYEIEKLQFQKRRDVVGRIEVKASVSGIISDVTAAAEGYHVAKDTCLCKIVNPDSAYIMLYAENKVLPTDGKVLIDIYRSEQDFEGTVVYSGQDISKTIYDGERILKEDSLQMTHVSYIKPAEGNSTEGLTAFGVNVTTWRIPEAIVVSPKSVYSENDRKYVWVKKEDTVEKRYVTVGYHDVNQVWIARGLSEGEELIVGN